MYGRSLPQRYRDFGSATSGLATWAALDPFARARSRFSRKGSPERGRMKSKACPTCVAHEWLRLQLQIETKADCIQHGCNCAGVRRFVLCGAVPKNGTDADRLFADLKKQWGLSKKPGPKKKLTPFAVLQKAKSIGATTQSEVAGALEVSEKTIQRVLKPLSDLFPTFQELVEFLEGGGKSDKPRARRMFTKKINRRTG